MLGNKPYSEWISEYGQSHRNPVNRFFHTVGIPSIVVSLLMLIASPFVSGLWPYALGLFVFGWVCQFVGHWVEGQPPEFLKDWRFLFVGLRWWWAKVRGKA
ncbi:MAG: Mpo1-like protein [Flavobacteriales bacterium]